MAENSRAELETHYWSALSMHSTVGLLGCKPSVRALRIQENINFGTRMSRNDCSKSGFLALLTSTTSVLGNMGRRESLKGSIARDLGFYFLNAFNRDERMGKSNSRTSKPLGLSCAVTSTERSMN